MTITNKIKSIVNGYKNLIWKKEQLEPLFQQRLNTCSNCSENIGGICKLCGCIIQAKTRSISEVCPANYWKPILYCDENNNHFRFYKKEELPEEFQSFFNDEIIPERKYTRFIEFLNKELDKGEEQ